MTLVILKPNESNHLRETPNMYMNYIKMSLKAIYIGFM